MPSLPERPPGATGRIDIDIDTLPYNNVGLQDHNRVLETDVTQAPDSSTELGTSTGGSTGS
ncbi:hypothetical protein ACIQ7Q_05705 [Streptomyces sp. NPDC096176]|uniref:hypothetical protein n=1 Tax=Streptomyces sp. NPDC096176 TaxID=3366079 RepID=UPI00380944A4